MKPCRKYKKKIVLLSAGVLQPSESVAIQEHLVLCEACNTYWREMRELCAEQRSAAQSLAQLDEDYGFHQRLKRALRSAQASPFPRSRMRAPRWSQMLKLAAVGAACIIVVVLSVRRAPPPLPRVAEKAEPEHQQPVKRRFEPTIAAYKSAAFASSDNLENLLTQQNAPVHAAPPITIPRAFDHAAAE